MRALSIQFLRFLSFAVLICALFLPAAAGAVSADFVRFDRARESFRKGIHFFNKNQYLAAAEFFRNAVTTYPDYHAAREYLARSYKHGGFVNEALKEWESLSSINENNVYIQNKIDTIRFRGAKGSTSTDYGSLVMSDQYISRNLKRFRFPAPTDIAIDSDKNLYVTSFASGKISKIDPNGQGVATFSPSMKSKLYGIDCFENTLAVSDFKADMVYLMDLNCTIKKKIGFSGSGEGQFRGPEGVAFDRKGHLYVADSGNNRVQKFHTDGMFILKFGEPGEYEGQFNSPTGVTVADNKVYVTDAGNRRIACFDDSGNFIKNIRVENLNNPRGISWHNNTLVVSDERNGLLFYDPANETSSWFTSWENGSMSFTRLFSSRFDREGLLYSVDHSQEKVFVFSPSQLAYSNLDMEITSIDTRDYPTVAVCMNIRSRNGMPIYALRRENFRIVEDSATASRVTVDYLKDQNPSVSIALCVDRSTGNQAFHGEMPWAAEFILRKMHTDDRIKLINFSGDFWAGSDFDWSRRRTLEALREKRYENGKNYGTALYNAISDLLPKQNRRAVVMLTSGAPDAASFQKYSAQYIIEYAKSHYIPVYIVTFNEKDPTLSCIAAETGGGIYRASEVERLREIYDRVKRSEEYRYLLLYRSYKLPSFKGWWADIRIELNYRGQRGYEWGGYFVP